VPRIGRFAAARNWLQSHTRDISTSAAGIAVGAAGGGLLAGRTISLPFDLILQHAHGNPVGAMFVAMAAGATWVSSGIAFGGAGGGLLSHHLFSGRKQARR
jgi:hypothetical protein